MDIIIEGVSKVHLFVTGWRAQASHSTSHAIHRLLLQEQVHLLRLQISIGAPIIILLLLIEHVLLMHLLLRVMGGLLFRAAGGDLVPVGSVGGGATLARYGAATTRPPILVRLQLLTETLSKRLLLHRDGARRYIALLLLDLLRIGRQLAHGLPRWLVLRLCRGAG